MIDSVENLTQFGVASLMGALWLWERFYSRKREYELTQAHERLIAQHDELKELIALVQRNTAAIERFEQTQSRFVEVLERLSEARHAA